MKVKAPKEDPALKASREREEARAESAFINETQGVLDDETRRRTRRLGRRAALTGFAPGGGARPGGSFVPIGGYVSGGGGSTGGGFGDFGGGFNTATRTID